ncbi:MAG: acyltransferase, partial [Dysgonamonadaceae bacterium]|nr:acyltransferase [Dysgonamonadaceae bacterium]
MKHHTDFDDIRPYNDDEVVPTIEKLILDPQFKQAMGFIFPNSDWDKQVALLRSFTNLHELQHSLIKGAVYDMVSKTAASIECAGLENIEKERAYTYISNHRDIVLDAALLCAMLVANGYDTTEIA